MKSKKWMKQISKVEYKNYIMQESSGSGSSSNVLDIAEDVSSVAKLKNNQHDDEDFFTLSTLPSLEKSSNIYLADLLGASGRRVKTKRSSDEFDLFIRNSDSVEETFEAMRSKGASNHDDDESLHYITLSSPQVEERMSYDPQRHVYMSQLILKQAQVKDSGVYVCFGPSTKGYVYRKSQLKVSTFFYLEWF